MSGPLMIADGSPELKLYEMLVTGVPSDRVYDWLNDKLTERVSYCFIHWR